MTTTDFFGVLEVLLRHEVDFVLIGGLAARLHGSPSVTVDVDVCPAREPENLARLADALRELDARLRTPEDDVGFVIDAEMLGRASNLTLTTSHGYLDVLAEPIGTRGYVELIGNARVLDVEGMKLPVVSLSDLIRMKEASGRPKDRIELEVLGALKEELESGGSE